MPCSNIQVQLTKREIEMKNYKHDDIKDRIQTINGKPFSQKIALKGMSNIQTELIKKLNQKQTQNKESAHHYKNVFAPITKIITQDNKALTSIKHLKKLSKIKKPELITPTYPRIKPQIRSGSFLIITAPPYDFDWKFQSLVHGNTGGQAQASKINGRFTADYSVFSGGSALGAGGVGIFFRPIAESTWVRFSPYIKFSYAWHDWSNLGPTAHSDGYLAIRVISFNFNGGDVRIEQDPRFQLWSDGTGWSEDHSNSDNDDLFPVAQSTIYFQATSNRLYNLWIWGYSEGNGTDGDIFWSNSWASLKAFVPFAVIEQWS